MFGGVYLALARDLNGSLGELDAVAAAVLGRSSCGVEVEVRGLDGSVLA